MQEGLLSKKETGLNGFGNSHPLQMPKDAKIKKRLQGSQENVAEGVTVQAFVKTLERRKDRSVGLEGVLCQETQLQNVSASRRWAGFKCVQKRPRSFSPECCVVSSPTPDETAHLVTSKAPLPSEEVRGPVGSGPPRSAASGGGVLLPSLPAGAQALAEEFK